MRNIFSALARALRGAVYLPFWLLDNTWDAFKTAWRPRVNEETEYAAAAAQHILETAADPKVAEMDAVAAALRVVVVNSNRSADDCLPMKLDGIDSRWSQWLSRLDAPQAQRAVNAHSSRPGALEAHRSGNMPMIGIPRVKSDAEYEKDEKEALEAAREDLVSQAMNFTPEQDAAFSRPSADGRR